MKKIVIGLVGESGVGKGTFTQAVKKVLSKQGIKTETVRFSDLLKEILDLLFIPATRINLQDLAIILKNHWGLDVLPNAISQRIKKSKAKIIFLEGLRWQKDEELLRSFENSILIYITAPAKTRYDRMLARNEKIGESTMSWAQFLKESKKPNELMISEIGSRADLKLVNTGSLKSFEKEIRDKFFSLLKI